VSTSRHVSTVMPPTPTKKTDVWAEIPISGVTPIGGLSIGVGFTENTGIEPKEGAVEETFDWGYIIVRYC
jgi:hypothetical protein